MKVQLIDYTGIGQESPSHYAAALLLYIKSTRLDMNPDGLRNFLLLPYSVLLDELEKVAITIPSCWEFVNYTFFIGDVTRAFTHQLVRTRTASYAQQTMRILGQENFTYDVPPNLNDDARSTYEATMGFIQGNYNRMLQEGAHTEDARGVLPTNIHTNICMHCNLRTLAELTVKRTSPRVQGEYRDVLESMVQEVGKVHNWAPSLFLNRDNTQVVKDLDSYMRRGGVPAEVRTNVWKYIDQLRRQE